MVFLVYLKGIIYDSFFLIVLVYYYIDEVVDGVLYLGFFCIEKYIDIFLSSDMVNCIDVF